MGYPIWVACDHAKAGPVGKPARVTVVVAA